MTSTLFDLDDFEETRPEWVLVGEWGRCGLCGTKCSYNQGGTRTGAVCDGCAQVDLCTIRPHDPVIERRPSSLNSALVEVAHCSRCGWWVLEHYRDDDGNDVAYTPDELLDMCSVHVAPRHTSHWGFSHEIADHDRLVAAQAKRRAAFLKRVAA
jgi:hypothetical protein